MWSQGAYLQALDIVSWRLRSVYRGVPSDPIALPFGEAHRVLRSVESSTPDSAGYWAIVSTQEIAQSICVGLLQQITQGLKEGPWIIARVSHLTEHLATAACLTLRHAGLRRLVLFGQQARAAVLGSPEGEDAVWPHTLPICLFPSLGEIAQNPLLKKQVWQQWASGEGVIQW
jgi:DNA polymerase III psi subunit